jgi:hypothetical protein
MKSVLLKTFISLSVWFGSTMLVARAGLAQTKPAVEPQIPQLLFVQNAEAVVTDKSGRVLTLQGLSPTTLYFTDRPVRTAGHYRTDEYLRFWKQGPESFLKDPPNSRRVGSFNRLAKLTLWNDGK